MKRGQPHDRRQPSRVLALGWAGLLVVAGVALVVTWGVRRARIGRLALEAAQRVDRELDDPAPTPPPETTPLVTAPPEATRTVLPTTTALPVPTATPMSVASRTLGRLEIPRLDLRVPVLDGVGTAELDAGAGHFPETAALGESGNCALAAHRDTHFRPLSDVRVGDRVVVEAPGRTTVYHVVSTEVVTPGAVRVLDDVGDDRLTLVTCYPFAWVGPAPRRFVVVAERDVGGDTATPASTVDVTDESVPRGEAVSAAQAGPGATG